MSEVRPLTRHRRRPGVIDVLARVGTLVSFTALLVVAAAAGGAVDGSPVGEPSTVTITFDR
ncbi:hypothetical protein WEH80_12795 [Actinomycetes bacterium KLBMP 9759]